MSQARFTLTVNCLRRTGSSCWESSHVPLPLAVVAVMIPFDPFRLAYFSLWLKSHQPRITIHAEIDKSHVASNFARTLMTAIISVRSLSKHRFGLWAAVRHLRLAWHGRHGLGAP